DRGDVEVVKDRVAGSGELELPRVALGDGGAAVRVKGERRRRFLIPVEVSFATGRLSRRLPVAPRSFFAVLFRLSPFALRLGRRAARQEQLGRAEPLELDREALD